MRYRRLLPLGLGLVAVAALIVYWARAEPAEVRVAPVSRGTVEWTVTNTRAGTVEAIRRARVAPVTSGQVTHLPVAEGDRVEQGELLLELWNADLRAERAVAETRARAFSARATQTCVQAEAAEREAARLERLRARGSASEEATDRAVSAAASASAGCRAARVEAEQARRGVDATEAALERTRLTAPFAGVVAELNAELGEIVTPSPPGIPTPPAVDLIDATTLYVSAPIDEVDAPAVTTDLSARIRLDAFPDRTFPGHVTRIAPYVLDREKQARTVEVEVTFTSVPETTILLPGYSADAEIVIDRAEDVLHIPAEALRPDGTVLVVSADHTVAERAVVIGLRNWDVAEVREGLSADERVVLGTPAGVTPGMAVRPLPAEAP